MKKRKIKSNKRASTPNTSSMNQSFSGNIYNYCKELLSSLSNNNKLDLPDYYFAIAVIAREEKEYSIERQAIINLLFYVDTYTSSFIRGIISGNHHFQFTERTEFLSNFDEITYDCHDYYKIVISFIKSCTKQQVTSYFNCFMGRSPTGVASEVFIKDVNTLPDKILLDFFEVTHRLLLDYSRNEDTLRKLTLYINKLIKEHYSKNFLFFLSYFNLNSDDLYAIEIAHKYLITENISLNIFNYSDAIAWNTSYAALRLGNLDNAMFWCERIKDSERRDKILNIISKKEAELSFRDDHPLNPGNIQPSSLDEISTKDLFSLAAYLYGCGDDWGFKQIKKYGRYIYPSQKITIETFKELAINGLVKISKPDFMNISDSELNNFNKIISESKFHLNINGVADNKKIALSIIKEELGRREDKYTAFIDVWKTISIGYFFNSMDFYLGNIQDNWARDIEINEKTIQRLGSINLSPQILSYIAKVSTRFTAGKHSIGETYGDKNTKNILIGSINRNIDWLENGSFIDNSMPRYKNQPILSIETIAESIFDVTPEMIYNNAPTLILIKEVEDNNYDF